MFKSRNIHLQRWAVACLSVFTLKYMLMYLKYLYFIKRGFLHYIIKHIFLLHYIYIFPSSFYTYIKNLLSVFNSSIFAKKNTCKL